MRMSALFFGLGIGFILLFSIVGIGLYVLKSLGLYAMATKRDIENAWLAWIPIGDLHIIGKLVGPFNISTFKLDNPEVILPISGAIALVCGAIPLIGWLIATASYVLYCFAIYNLFIEYDEEHSVLFIILSIIFHVEGIFYFIIRNNNHKKNINIL